MDYLDFELCIAAGEGRSYPISVVRSPAGEHRGTMRFPFDELELKSRLQTLQIALLKSGSTRRDLVQPEEQVSVQHFGKMLFEAALPDEVRSCYRISRDKAKASGRGLRVRLRIEAPDLAALPWEFMYDETEGDFVCLSNETPIVRYLELDRPPTPIAIEPPLRILGMIAAPQDRSTLNVDREKARMKEAIAELEERGLVTLTWLEGQTWRDLQRAMRQGPWHVFHFVGHGGFDAMSGEGMLALSDDDGRTFRLPATQLGRLLADHRDLRLAVLNACEGAQASETDIFSSTASVLIRRGIPAVVAMQYEITDRAAIEFGHVFYQALAEGLPVDAAVSEARKAISLSVTNTVEWGTPVLHMRAPDGLLFDIDAAKAVPPPAPPPPVVEKVAEPIPESTAPAPAAQPVPRPRVTSALDEDVHVSKKTLLWSTLGVVAVLVLAGAAYFLLRPSGPVDPGGSAPAPPGPVAAVLVGRVQLIPAADTLRTGQDLRIGVSLVDVDGNGMSEGEMPPDALEWTVEPPDLATLEPDASGVGATLRALAPGTVTLTATAAEERSALNPDSGGAAIRPADTKRVTILTDAARLTEVLTNYIEAEGAFNDERVANDDVRAAYTAFTSADRQALEESGQVTTAALDSVQARLERIIALYDATQRQMQSDTLTLGQKIAAWRLYKGRADSVRSSPSTLRASTTIDSLGAVQAAHVMVERLDLCQVPAPTCPTGSITDRFGAGRSVNFSFRQQSPPPGRTQNIHWRWLGPDGAVLREERYALRGDARTYQNLPGRFTETPGRYELRLFNAADHLIARRVFFVE